MRVSAPAAKSAETPTVVGRAVLCFMSIVKIIYAQLFASIISLQPVEAEAAAEQQQQK